VKDPTIPLASKKLAQNMNQSKPTAIVAVHVKNTHNIEPKTLFLQTLPILPFKTPFFFRFHKKSPYIQM